MSETKINPKKKYNHTLLMPVTDFSMRAGLVKKEAKYSQKWNDMDLYRQLLKRNKNNKSFFLHDGPPYANGNLHVGHAFNKILKDMVIRYKTLQGFYAPFIAGWDTHGLPIEHKMLTTKKIKFSDLDKATLRNMCKDYALSQVEIQLNQFKKMNLLTDFKDYYVTLDKRYEAKQIEIFAKMVEQKIIYRDLKPIYWSPSSQSALAEAEIEYLEHRSPSVYVACKIKKTTNPILKDAELVIWTTTPWTLIANAAIAVHKDIDYALIQVDNGRKLVVAQELIESLKTAIGWSEVKTLATFSGRDLVGITYLQPVDNTIKKVVLGHHVTIESGSGLVHIAPGFGEDDFRIGKDNNLDMIVHVSDDGTLTKDAGELSGLFYADANKPIGMALASANKLLKLKFIKHQYPHDWRTKKPVMYRATLQWFVSIEPIKAGILKTITADVSWHPSWGESRLAKMISDRSDWCISRQRSWGVPIPIFYDKNNQPIYDQAIFAHVADLFKTHGSNIWFEKDADDLLPAQYRNQKLRKETDIMDVWFDSGVSHYAISAMFDVPKEIDLYLEGSDQYRGWYNSSMITGYVAYKKSPYKNVFSHGFVLDEAGNKMSKSVGNVIDPLKVINTLGADILRLWVASSEAINDVHIGQNILKQTSENYRKIRNTLRFMIGNLADFNFETDSQVELASVDQYVLLRWNILKQEIINNYDNFKMHLVVKEVLNFIVDVLSSFYFDFAKDILYITKAKSTRRLQVQSVIFTILNDLLVILAPILVTTIEEAYEHINITDKHDSVHFMSFYKKRPPSVDHDLLSKWKTFLELRSQVFKELEIMRNDKIIGKSLEAQVDLELPESFRIFDNDNIAQLLIVSQLSVKYSNTKQPIIKVSKADGLKCMRCWHIEEGANMHDSEICSNCFSEIS